ncbi:MAG: CotH kinase family protein [Lachnospiraceae bacterium]|nr:CotH kinase family protein [Lachnospiraceae bacterium]
MRKRNVRRSRRIGQQLMLLFALLAIAILVATVVNSRRLKPGTTDTRDVNGDPGESDPEHGTKPTAAPTGTDRPDPTATPTAGVVTEPTPTAGPTPTPVLLYINEILPTNNKYNKHNEAFFDAVELYNASEETIRLGDFFLSDSKKHLKDYPLPDIELPAGAYTVVYCTGKYEVKEECDLPFKLSYFGEKVYLAGTDGNIIDVVDYPELPQNVSYGRVGEEYRIFDTPSLGEANEGGYGRMATVPEVDLAPGFYEGSQQVSFTSAGTIRYTLDGSKPTSSSKVWDGNPIAISGNCSVRAYAEEEGCLNSFPVTFNYFIDAPEYELDVARLSIKQSDLDRMNENYESSTKYAANLSLFVDGHLEFSEDCAVSTFGGSSRAYIKKSYQITFSTAFGPSKLRYPLFDNMDEDEYNSIVLRGGSQDNEATLMRDEMLTSLVTDYGLVDDLLVQSYRPVNLYINDEYRGIYYIREHTDEYMVASHYGCDPEEVTLVKQMHTVKCGKEAKEWTDLWKFISEHRLTDEESYEYVKSVVDLQSVADYYVVQLWDGNIDPDNICVCKPGDKFGGRWIYVLYDLDLTLTRGVSGSTNELIGTFNTGYYTFNALIYRLLENEEFRELFCERMAYIIQNVVTDERCNEYIDRFVEMLDHDMVYNCARWNPVRDPVKKTNYRSYSGWQSSVKTLREMITGRGPKIIRDFVQAKGISEELTEKYFSTILN